MKKSHLFFFLIILILVIGYGTYHWLKPKPHYPMIDSPRPTTGNPNATIVLSEWGDIQCPSCGYAQEGVHQIMEEYREKIKLEFKHFPLITAHPLAFEAAEAAECANDQHFFWDYLEVEYLNQKDLRESQLISFAKDLGLDMDSFTNCLLSGAKFSVVEADRQDGLRLDLKGTPTFFINGEVIQGFTHDALRSAIEHRLSPS